MAIAVHVYDDRIEGTARMLYWLELHNSLDNS